LERFEDKSRYSRVGTLMIPTVNPDKNGDKCKLLTLYSELHEYFFSNSFFGRYESLLSGEIMASPLRMLDYSLGWLTS